MTYINGVTAPAAANIEATAEARGDVEHMHETGDGIDLVAAEQAIAQLLRALGRDPHSEQFALTPKRVAQNLRDLSTSAPLNISMFPNPGDHGEPVVMRDIPFVSVCEHHLLPFRGIAHVGYAPLTQMVGFSAFVQVVEHFARDFQVQERLTAAIADFLIAELDTRGVGVTIEAEHSCVSTRGAKAHSTSAVTQSFRGELADDPHFRSLLCISAAEPTRPRND